MAQRYTFQIERGRKEEGIHIQGCFVLIKPLSWTGVYERNLVKLGYTGWCSPIKDGKLGEIKSRRYCSKTDTRLVGPWEAGWDDKIAEKAKSAKEAVADLAGGMTLDKFIMQHPSHAMRSFNNVQKIREHVYEAPARSVKVFVHVGKPGTGKSTAVYNLHGDDKVFTLSRPTSSSSQLWFDGYDPEKHEAVLFDDFYGWIKISNLLQWCDPAQTRQRVPIKGGFVAWRPAFIYFTSNVEWRQWYKKHFEEVPDHIQAVHRRLTEVRQFKRKHNWVESDGPVYDVIDKYDVARYDESMERPVVDGDNYQPADFQHMY